MTEPATQPESQDATRTSDPICDPPATRTCESYGRTDGLTEKDLTLREDQSGTSTGARVAESHELPDWRTVLSEALDVLEQRAVPEDAPRHPVIRTGERPPYPPHLRRLVWLRDGQRCRICSLPLPFESLEVDHITPWSAGGDHRSTNLRATCQICNQARGNRADMEAERRRHVPVTPMCTRCITDHPTWVKATHPGSPWLFRGEDPNRADQVNAFCGCCRWVSLTPVWNVL